MSEGTRGLDFAAGLLIGTLVGAAAAILLTPQSGEQTRTLIREKGIELREQVDTLPEKARKRAETLQSQARQKAEEIQIQVKRAVDEGKAVAAKRKEELLAQLEHPAAQEETAAE